jgi:hypothetical protein
MESKRGSWIEEAFTKRDESYLVNDGYVEGFVASITPREGFFDLEVYRNEYEYVRDDDIGVHVEGHREEYLNSRELTVDNIRTAVREFEITVPESLANELTEWQEKYWEGHAGEIDKIAEELKGVLTQIIYNDMSAMDEEERWVGTAELAQETLSRPDLAGVVPDDKMRIMVMALRDLSDGRRHGHAFMIAQEALEKVGAMGTPAAQVEAPEWNVSPDDRFPTLGAYETALGRMEEEGIARMEREMNARATSLYWALDDIRRLGGHRTDERVFADTVALARLTLSEHERDLRFFGQTTDVQVMHLALRTIAISDELSTYAASSPIVNTKAVGSGVQAFKSGVEFLTKLNEQGMSVGGESIDAIAKVVYQAGRNGASTYAQLGERMSAIAGAAIDEVNSMRHSIDQGVSLDRQKTSEVGRGNQGIGVAL